MFQITSFFLGQQSSWKKYRSPSTPQDGNNNNNDGSSWDEIRARNSVSTTWDKIRQNNQIGLKQQQQKSTSDRNYDGNSNEKLPRTKEDFEELYGEGKIRTNQYGDV